MRKPFRASPCNRFRNLPINGPDIVDYDLWRDRLELLMLSPDVQDPENGSMHERVTELLAVIEARKPIADAMIELMGKQKACRIEQAKMERARMKAQARPHRKARSPQMQDAIGRAAAADVGNRRMRKGGRNAWDQNDYNAACAELHRLFGPLHAA